MLLVPIVPNPPDYDDPKEVYAFYGLAAYTAQLFEQSIILLIVGLEATHPTIPLKGKTFDEAFARLDKQTLGQLIKNATGLAGIEESIISDLSDLLTKRNYLRAPFFSREF